MRVKITAHFGEYSHADLTKGIYVNVEDKVANEWAANGWCVIVPEEKQEKKATAPIETAALKQPETAVGVRQRAEKEAPAPPPAT